VESTKERPATPRIPGDGRPSGRAGSASTPNAPASCHPTAAPARAIVRQRTIKQPTNFPLDCTILEAIAISCTTRSSHPKIRKVVKIFLDAAWSRSAQFLALGVCSCPGRCSNPLTLTSSLCRSRMSIPEGGPSAEPKAAQIRMEPSPRKRMMICHKCAVPSTQAGQPMRGSWSYSASLPYAAGSSAGT
jgi:hypothetical protein